MKREVNGFPVWNALKSDYLILSLKGIYIPFLFPRGSVPKKFLGRRGKHKPYYYGKEKFMGHSLIQLLRVNYIIQQSKNIKTMFKALLSIWYEYSYLIDIRDYI